MRRVVAQFGGYGIRQAVKIKEDIYEDLDPETFKDSDDAEREQWRRWNEENARQMRNEEEGLEDENVDDYPESEHPGLFDGKDFYFPNDELKYLPANIRNSIAKSFKLDEASFVTVEYDSLGYTVDVYKKIKTFG